MPKKKAEIEDVLNVISDLSDMVSQRFDAHDARFDRIEAEQKRTRQQIEKIMGFLDSIAKRQEISDDERLVMGHQLDRLNRWVGELADKIGHKLSA